MSVRMEYSLLHWTRLFCHWSILLTYSTIPTQLSTKCKIRYVVLLGSQRLPHQYNLDSTIKARFNSLKIGKAWGSPAPGYAEPPKRTGLLSIAA